jgi:hypothetical protein
MREKSDDDNWLGTLLNKGPVTFATDEFLIHVERKPGVGLRMGFITWDELRELRQKKKTPAE